MEDDLEGPSPDTLMLRSQPCTKKSFKSELDMGAPAFSWKQSEANNLGKQQWHKERGSAGNGILEHTTFFQSNRYRKKNRSLVEIFSNNTISKRKLSDTSVTQTTA